MNDPRYVPNVDILNVLFEDLVWSAMAVSDEYYALSGELPNLSREMHGVILDGETMKVFLSLPSLM